jgi:N-acetylmuramic acid 6-phosphate (MurNAc-6-P) etherase
MSDLHPGITAGPVRNPPPNAAPASLGAGDSNTTNGAVAAILATPIQAATANVIEKEGTSWRANIPFVLLVIVTCGLFGLIAILCFHEVPPTNQATVNTVLGIIATGWGMGVGYFWGTSASSKAKDATITAMASK